MITYIEARFRHHHAAHQRRHGVERVGTMYDKPCFDSVLPYLFRIERRAKAMGEQHSQRPIEPHAEARISGEVLLERVARNAQHGHRVDRALKMPKPSIAESISAPRDVRGRTIVNSVNSPGWVSTSIEPACCLTMMS